MLHGLNMQVETGEFLALMGPSGSGKTTLLNLIGGLDQPDKGEVTVAGERLDQLSSGRLAKWRARNVGFIFQFYNLLPVLTAERNVEVPLLLTKLTGKERRRNVAAALAAGRPRRPREAQARGAFRRSAAAGRDRARDRVGPEAARLRRADRRPRPRHVGVDPRAATASEPRARQNHHHGDARPARRGPCVAAALRRQG